MSYLLIFVLHIPTTILLFMYSSTAGLVIIILFHDEDSSPVHRACITIECVALTGDIIFCSSLENSTDFYQFRRRHTEMCTQYDNHNVKTRLECIIYGL